MYSARIAEAPEKVLARQNSRRYIRSMNHPIWTNYAWVALGGALGAMARMGVGHWIRGFAAGPFPWPTFAINISGSFLLGAFVTVIAGRAMPNTVALNHLVAIGFLGAFTTFSTFELETWNLVNDGRWLMALMYVVSSVAVGFTGLGIGIFMARLAS